jgi:hypothetical protein
MTMTDELPTHLDAQEMPGALEVYQLKLKHPDRHGAMTVTHVRAVDLAQAEQVGRRYCALHKFTFVNVSTLCVADTSVLDLSAPH